MSFKSGGLVEQINITATAAGTTTLVGSTTSSATLGKPIQVFTGSTTQTVVLPVATTMVVGQKFEIYNESSAALTLQFSDATPFTDAAGISYTTLAAHSSLILKLQTNTTADGTWTVFSGGGVTGGGANVPTVQKFLSGSGTYTTPSNVLFIQVKMVGGGGGGSGTGTASQGTGGTGGNTTFGSSLLTANGGNGAIYSSNVLGGTASVTTSSTVLQIVALQGAAGPAGAGGPGTPSVNAFSGGSGGSTPFGGAGAGAQPTGTGNTAIANTGSGGGGGSGGGVSDVGGSGGAAGGYVEAIITNPSSTYSYSVGASGAGGTAGTSGFAGGAGGSGVIIVTEYYGNTLATAMGGGAVTPTVTVLSSGSGTFTTPSNALYLQVEMVGGGGGGAGAGGGGSGGTGGTTTFGTSLLTCTGGIGSTGSSQGGAAGGTATVGSGPLVLAALSGGSGTGDGANVIFSGGGTGAPSPFGGAGGGGLNTAGFSAIANTGSGGGGGGSSSTVAAGGGGAGGYIKAIITNPLSSYAYSVGAAGTAGTGSPAGGAGGSGVIIVTTYYNNGAVGTATNVTGVVAVANGGTGNTSGGMIGSNWVAYTPTFTAFGTVTGVSMYWRRVGDSLDIQGSFVTGTPTGTSMAITLPSGLVTDSTSKFPSSNGIVGYLQRPIGTTTTWGQLTAIASNGNGFVNVGTLSSATNAQVAANGNAAVGTGEGIFVNITGIPISGWTWNV